MILTDDILLEVFVFYRHTYDDALWNWHVLVHVCRRWRHIVFESPRRLDLKIRCKTRSRVRENLSIWPVLPIAIDFRAASFETIPRSALDALENADRVAYFKLHVAILQSKTFAAMTSKPFPVLTRLVIYVKDRYTALLPDEFLGGFAPRLQAIHFRNVAFPGIQRLLRSTSDLIELQLRNIPIFPADNLDYLLPVPMATCLAILPRLETLVLHFNYLVSPPDPMHPPPDTQAVLPALTNFEFAGTSKYLEDFIAQIVCPRLKQIKIFYLIDDDEFRLVQLTRYFNRSMPPFKHAKFSFGDRSVTLDLYRPTNHIGWDSHRPATTIITCEPIGSGYLFRMLDELRAMLATVVDLKFGGKSKSWESRLGDEYNPQWLHFLCQLSSLQALYASPVLAGNIGRALKSVKDEVVAETLPLLDLICLEGQASLIEEFVVVRQLSGRPLTVVDTEVEFDQRLSEKLMMSYTH